MHRKKRKLLRGLVIGAVCLVVLAGGLCLLYYISYPDPPYLYAHYASDQGLQNRYAMHSSYHFGNWLSKMGMDGFRIASDEFDEPYYAYCTITVPPGKSLRFTNQAKTGWKRYRVRRANIGISTLEDYRTQLGYVPPDLHAGKMRNAYEFQFAAPEIPGRYVMWLHVDFRTNGYATYYYFLDVK